MKERHFWIALCFIGLSWIANSLYAYSKQLDEPIFLDHYIEKVMHEGNIVTVTFYYLTNINDTSSVRMVSANGLNGYVHQYDNIHLFSDTNDIGMSNVQTFTHYALRSIDVEFNTFESEPNDGLFSFNEMDIYFSDGNQMTAPVGEIMIHLNNPFDDMFDATASHSSESYHKSSYRFKEEVVIEDISIGHGDLLKDKLFITIDFLKNPTRHSDANSDLPGIDVHKIEFPLNFENNDKFYVYNKRAPDFIGSVQVPIKFYGKTKASEEFLEYGWIYQYPPYLEQKDVKEIIEAKTKGDAK